MSPANHDEPWPLPIASHPGERDHPPRHNNILVNHVATRATSSRPAGPSAGMHHKRPRVGKWVCAILGEGKRDGVSAHSRATMSSPGLCLPEPSVGCHRGPHASLLVTPHR